MSDIQDVELEAELAEAVRVLNAVIAKRHRRAKALEEMRAKEVKQEGGV